MIDVSKLDNVLDAILEEGDIELTDELRTELEQSTPMGLLDRFLTWHGIVGYTEMIVNAMETIKVAQGPGDIDKLVDYLWEMERDDYMVNTEIGDEEEAFNHALKHDNHIFCTLAKLHLKESMFEF